MTYLPYLPEKKVTAAAGGAAAVVILSWVLRALNVDVPPVVIESAVVLAVAVLGWLAPHTRRGPDAQEQWEQVQDLTRGNDGKTQ